LCCPTLCVVVHCFCSTSAVACPSPSAPSIPLRFIVSLSSFGLPLPFPPLAVFFAPLLFGLFVVRYRSLSLPPSISLCLPLDLCADPTSPSLSLARTLQPPLPLARSCASASFSSSSLSWFLLFKYCAHSMQ